MIQAVAAEYITNRLDYIGYMKKFSKNSPDWCDAQPGLRDWYQTSLGNAVLDTVADKFDEILPGIFGYQGVQVGQIAPGRELLSSAGLHRRLVIDSFASESLSHISADVEHLPISSDCVNLVFYPHALEFCDSPHAALREADRILTDDGHLLVMGFNPWSSFGVRRVLGRAVPWNGKSYSRARVQDWLSVLGFRVVSTETVFLRPPINRAPVLRRTKLLEKTQKVLGFAGGVYLIHARKQTVPMTLSRQQWLKPRGRLVTGAFAQRTGRTAANRDGDIDKPS